MTTAKPKSTRMKENQQHLNGAVILGGHDDYRPTTNTAWDIETAPLGGDNDGSLLDPQTARVGAIGYYEISRDLYLIAYDADESAMLRQFWQAFASVQGAGAKFIGFNIQGFDLPFLIRRSWHHGISIPKTLMSGGK